VPHTNSKSSSISSGYVVLGVCLFISLSVRNLPNYWTDLHENFTTDLSVDKEELIKFRKWSASVSGFGRRIFRMILQYCEIGHFTKMWLISPEKNWANLQENFIHHKCNFWQRSLHEILEVIRIRSPDGPGLLIRKRFALAEDCALGVLLIVTWCLLRKIVCFSKLILNDCDNNNIT